MTPGGPAEKAGWRSGDVIVGVAARRAKNLADFYRKVWAQGAAGAASRSTSSAREERA